MTVAPSPAQLATTLASSVAFDPSKIMPGIYKNVPFADYRAWPHLSHSILKHGDESGSMAALRAAMDGDRIIKPTDDMILGSALHVAFLEPEQLHDRVVCWKGDRRAGAAWDEFKAANAGKYILTSGYYAKMLGMVDAMRRHPWVKSVSPQVEAVEVSVVGDVHGVIMKGRADALVRAQDMIVDVKKVRSNAYREFQRAIVGYGYDIQAWVYTKLVGASRFVLLTVEDEPPYEVVPYEMSPQFIRLGQRRAVPILDQYKFATKIDVWPGRSDELLTIDAPEWAMDDAAIDPDIGGGE